LKARPKEAIDALDDLAGEHPGDSSIEHLAARSRVMRECPPDADWDAPGTDRDAPSRFEVK
jgi:hypothetical protein